MRRSLLFAFLIAVLCAQAANVPPFAAAKDWKSANWRPSAPAMFDRLSFNDGVMTLALAEGDAVQISSASPLATNIEAGTELSFSVDFMGSGVPKNYEYGMVLVIKYTDGTDEKWTNGQIFVKFPKEQADYKTFTAKGVAAKAVKEVSVKFLFNAKCKVMLRNPRLTVGKEEKSAEQTVNQVPNPEFKMVDGKLKDWNFHGAGAAKGVVADGVVSATVAKELFEIDSAVFALKEPDKPVRFGIEAEIDAKPASWKYIVVLDAVYVDGSKGKWTDAAKLPKKTDGFVKIEGVFKPTQPVKHAQLKVFFEAEGSIKIRRPFVFSEQASAPVQTVSEPAPAKIESVTPQPAAVPFEEGNLAPNPHLLFDGTSMAGWNVGGLAKIMKPIKGGGFNVSLPAQAGFALSSQTIELNQTKPVTLRYGVSFKGKCYPVSYHHGLLLDKVVYMDGTTEGWSATHFIFRFQSENWSREETAWLPPKPIKSLRLYFLFKETADAEFSLKDVFLKEDPDAFSTPNADSNFDSSPVNLVSNGNFEIIKAGTIKNWIPFFETHPLNMSLGQHLDVAIDSAVRRSGLYSVRLSCSGDSIAGIESTVTSIIDYTREFTFSGWIKAENATGNTFLEAKFMRAWAPMGIGSAAGNELNRVYNRADTVGVYRTPITAGTHDWKRLSVTMTPPYGANLVTFRVYTINNKGTVWIDDLEFDGFGNAPLEIIESQLGYPVDGLKTVYVRSRKPLKGTFQLADENGKTVFSGELAPRGKDVWNCENYAAAFTPFKKEGRYTLKLLTSEGEFTRAPIEIRKDFYEHITEAGRDFMFHMRCGYDIPGFHPACHLDDGQLRSKSNLLAGGTVIGHHDVSGGWHDAGDYDKFPGPTVQPVVYFARLGERFKSAALLDESAWGAKWMNKIATPNGVYYQVLRLAENGQVIIDLVPPEDESDNVVGNADDRVAIGPGHDIMVAWALAEYALRTKDAADREKCLKTSRMLYDDFMKSGKRANKDFWQFNAAMLIETMLAYNKLTGDKSYLDELKPYMEIILQNVAQRIQENKWDGVVEAHFHPLSWAIVPLEYAIAFPDEPLSAKIRETLRPMVENIAAHLSESPLGIVEPSNCPYKALFARGGHSTIANISLAALMADAAVAYGKPEYLELAEGLFYFITGINEMAVSHVSGFGRKNAICWIACCAIPGHADGTVLKGAVLKGVYRGPGNRHVLPSYLSGGKQNFAVDHPSVFPAMMIAADFPTAGAVGSQEVWESLNGSAMRAIEAILKARESLKKKQPECAPLWRTSSLANFSSLTIES